jgi:hypothetical protein
VVLALGKERWRRQGRGYACRQPLIEEVRERDEENRSTSHIFKDKWL